MEFIIDSSKAMASLRWIGIGRAFVWYEDEWWLSYRILFYSKKIRIADMAKPKASIRKPHKRRKRPSWKKMIRIVKTFRVIEWKLFMDTGNYLLNAQIYPLNFMPKLNQHLFVNFNDENEAYLKIRNRPWKILLAFLK